MKKVYAIVAAALLMVGCAGDTKTYTLQGVIDGYEGEVAVANEISGDIYASANTTDGKFKMEFTSETPMFAVLVVDGQSTLPLFFDSAKPVKVKGSADKLGFLTASGGAANNAFADYMNASNALILELENAQSQHDYYEFQEKSSALLNQTYEDNKTNLWGAYLLTMSRQASMNSTEIVEAVEAFPARLRTLPELVDLYDKAMMMKRTEIGQPYTEINMVDYNGRGFKLSDVVAKSRYVLLDFWASWCNPCMKEIPFLQEAYNKYHVKGFEIYAVNLDDGREPWVKAIRDAGGMPWVHVGTQGGWDSHATQNYSVKAIPTNFLIDCKTGLIVDRNLRGEDIEAALSELFAEE
ncbi:MAG: AhpC/TSA family protein [Tidjanibacter sp.]|nr:AhpC/TSA family protein [Tidjanibacter sp.]